MKILVTGATGFIGTHLCRKLLEGNHEIMAVSRTCLFYTHRNNEEQAGSRISWVSSSLLLSAENFQKVTDFCPAVLIHLAWEKIPDFSFDISYENLQNQLTFFRNILNLPTLKKIIVAGSCLEYNKNFGKCSTDEPAISKDYFTWAKNTIHDFLRFECVTKNIALCWARIFYVYGPNQREGSLIPTLIRTFRLDSVPDLRSPANAHDFIYVDDVVSAFEQMILVAGGGIYNIGSGCAISVLDICKLVESRLTGNEKLSIQLAQRTSNTPASSDFWADMASSQALLNWKPVVIMPEGINRIIQFL